MVWFGTAQGDTRTTHTTRTAQNKIQCSYLRFSWVGSWVRWVNVYCDGSMCVAVTVKFIVYKTHKHLNYLHCSYNYIIIFLENAKTCKGQLSFVCIITSPVKYPSSLLDKEFFEFLIQVVPQFVFVILTAYTYPNSKSWVSFEKIEVIMCSHYLR